MSSKSKTTLIAVLLIGIVSMTIVYAALSQQLNISGSAKVQAKSQSWNIHFTDITSGSKVVTGGYASTTSSNISYASGNTTATMPAVTFKAPGDSVSFYFDVLNEGDITGYLNTINSIVVPDGTIEQGTLSSVDQTYFKGGIIATLTHADNSSLTLNESITKTNRIHLKLTLTLDSSLTRLPESEITFSNISTSLIFGQAAVN